MSTTDDEVRPYTPTTDEVRLAWIDRRDFEAQVQHVVGYTDKDFGVEFNRWLAAHDTEVKAEALREFATHYSENPADVDDESPADLRNELRRWADRIERGPL